jgi:type II secretory pathway pseudopilin PulG
MRVSIVLAVLATTLSGSGPQAQAQESSASQGQAPQAQAQASSAAQAQAQKGPTLGGHIGFVLPLVTHSGGQTTSLGDAPAVGFPVGITVKGSGPMAFDLEFVPQYNSTGTRQNTLTIHPGLIYGLGHNWAVGLRAAFVVDQPTVGFTPLVNKSFPIKHRNGGLLKAYFVEADLPVRFSRPVGAPATNAVTFAMHFGVAF